MASTTTTLTVRVSGPLSDFISRNVGDDGDYESADEYIRDLIRRDKERLDQRAFDRLKAELQRAFAAPEIFYEALTAAQVIERNRI